MQRQRHRNVDLYHSNRVVEYMRMDDMWNE
jgi:hypothetical protein